MSNPSSQPKTSPAFQPKRSKAKKRFFIFIILSVFLIAQEILFRLVFPIPETTRFNRIRYQLLAESDPRFKPLLSRGLVYDKLLFESSPDGWSYNHSLNRFGFREKDFSITPPPGKHRIIVVGDSVTEGQGAPASQTIAAHLNRQLGPSYEVLNLGVVAATIDKVTQLALDSTSILKPEALIVVLFANDMPAPPLNRSALLETSRNTANRALNEINAHSTSINLLPRLARLLQRLSNKQPLYVRFFKPVTRYFAPTPDSTNPFKLNQPPLAGLKPELEQAMRAGQLNPWLVQQSEAIPGMLKHDFALGGSPEDYLRLIQEICSKANIKFYVAYVPFYGTLHERYTQPLTDLKMPPEISKALLTDPEYKKQPTQLAAICSRLAIPFMDTSKKLQDEENRNAPQFWQYDSHPRPEGYKTISQAIAELLQQPGSK